MIPNSHAATRAPQPDQGPGQKRRSPNHAGANERARKRRLVGQGYVGTSVYRYTYGRVRKGTIVEYDLPVEHQGAKYMGPVERYTIDWGNGQASAVNWFQLEPFLNKPLKWQDDPGRRSVNAGQRMQPSEVDCALRAFNIAAGQHLTETEFGLQFVTHGVMPGDHGGFFVDWRVLMHYVTQRDGDTLLSDAGTESWSTLTIRMAKTPADMLPLRHAMAVGNIAHSGPGDTGHAAAIGRAEFGAAATEDQAEANRIRWNSLSWVLVAARSGYRQPWPLGLPWPLNLLRRGKGQGAPALTPLVVPPHRPKNPPKGPLLDSRVPAQRIQGLARKPCKKVYLPGAQIVRLFDPDHPDDHEHSTIVSRPHGGLCRIRLSTSSKAPIVHLRTAPGHPAGVGRNRIEDLGTEPVYGRAPWVILWGAPPTTPDWDLPWPRMPPNIHGQDGKLLPYRWRQPPIRPRTPPPGVLTALSNCESGALTEPAASAGGAGGAAGESTHQEQLARFASETRRGQAPLLQIPERSDQSDRVPLAGSAAFWAAERVASGLTSETLYEHGVRFTGSPSEWSTRGPRAWHRPGGAIAEGERPARLAPPGWCQPGGRRPVGNPPRDEPMPVDTPLGISHAESRKRRRPAAGGGAPDAYPALNDVTALVGPIRKEAQVVGQTLNGPLVEESGPEEWAQFYERFREAPEVGPQEAVLHKQMMATYEPKSEAGLTQVARWERHDRDRQYYPRIPSKVKPGVSLPFFCLDAVQRYTSWLLVEYRMATLDPVATALNNYYESHGYGRPWQGQRLKRWSEAYRLARERIARENGEKGAGLRENIQETGVKHLFDVAEYAGGNDLARLFNAITMIIFFFRANTMGAMEAEDDIYFDEHSGEIVFKVRALKGRHLAVPILKRLPPVNKLETATREWNGKPKHYRDRYFDLLRRVKSEGVKLNIYTNRLTAAGQINSYIADLFPPGLLGLRDGSFVSSHSLRKTGAVAAARTLCEFNNAIRPWGHWKSVTSAERYVADELYVVGVVADELFDFLPRLQGRAASFGQLNPVV